VRYATVGKAASATGGKKGDKGKKSESKRARGKRGVLINFARGKKVRPA